jgi:phosphoserine phosphatase
MTKELLPSWRDGAARQAIVHFVEETCGENGAPVEERVAVFDNDGTLWCEQPIQVQIFFLIDRAKELARKDPMLKERPAFRALLEQDFAALLANGKQGAMELFAATHAGMSEDEFETIARAWLASARHPKLGRLFTACTYRPQVELLGYLRDNGFKTYIVSGGGVDLMRAFAEEAYGIAREQVIGSSMKLRFEIKEGRPHLMKVGELSSFDDRDAKPANIALHIGRRPLLAFGNSDGDLAMMRYTKGGAGPRLALLLHHDDPEREFAYDREFTLSPLSEALDKADEYGITVVSMNRDWKAIFA